MKNKVTIKLSLLLLSIILSACAGPAVNNNASMTSSKMAVIRGIPGWNPLSVIAVQIDRIDGKTVKTKSNRFELLAGEHEIKVRCRRESPESHESVQIYYIFNMYLKAGHQYKPKLDMTRDCYLEYEDLSTGRKYQGQAE